MFGKLLRQTPKDIAEAKKLRDIGNTAFFQISSAISARKDLNTILEVIARESLSCLKADRCTIFLLDQKSGILKTQFAIALNPQDDQSGLFEEKEAARRVLKQRRPLLLKEPKDFSEFFKYEERERKVTSLMSIPISSQDKPTGVLSAILLKEGCSFNEKDLQVLSIFANHFSIALEMARLNKEMQKAKSFRDTYERYLDNILIQLQSLSEKERQLKEEHIARVMQERMFAEKQPFEYQSEEENADMDGTIFPLQELEISGRRDKRAGEEVQVEFEDEYSGMTSNLEVGGAFILTPNPMELGEQFSMKLYLAGGGDAIEVVCKVVFTNRYGKESKELRRGMGIKFLGLQPEGQKRIAESIKSHHLQAVGEIMLVAQESKS